MVIQANFKGREIIKNYKNMMFSLISALLSINLLGCQNDAPTHKKEVKETIQVYEDYKNVNNAKGIEYSSISDNNPLLKIYLNNLDNDLIPPSIVSPEEIQYGGTVYVDEAYSEHEIEPNITDNSNEQTEYKIFNNGTYVGQYTITAYSWTDYPMANGEYPYVGCAASNHFPIGTTIHIENIGTFTVLDRCGNDGIIDIYMNTVNECYQFGVQYANVYVIE